MSTDPKVLAEDVLAADYLPDMESRLTWFQWCQRLARALLESRPPAARVDRERMELDLQEWFWKNIGPYRHGRGRQLVKSFLQAFPGILGESAQAARGKQTRTPGTREVCERHSIWQNDPDSECMNFAMAGRECHIADCPIRQEPKP